MLAAVDVGAVQQDFFASASTSRSPAWWRRRPATSSGNQRTAATSWSWSSTEPFMNWIRKKWTVFETERREPSSERA